MSLLNIKTQIKKDPKNKEFLKNGWEPIYTAHPLARILIIGQAPGLKAQKSGVPWGDVSGDNLRDWLGIPPEVFYDSTRIALVPMDFYFPGKGKSGDNPPSMEFAEKWHSMILKEMPNIKFTILIGQYSQGYYLGPRQKDTLTKTVGHFNEYLPQFFPLVHPSTRNNIWQKKNPWFKTRVIPELKKSVKEALA